MKNKLLFLLKSFVYILIKSLIATILGYIYIYIYNGFRFYESNFSYFSKGFFLWFLMFSFAQYFANFFVADKPQELWKTDKVIDKRKQKKRWWHL